MTKDNQSAHALYVRELSSARLRERRRIENRTFFYVGLMDVVQEEIEYAVRYSRWRVK